MCQRLPFITHCKFNLILHPWEDYAQISCCYGHLHVCVISTTWLSKADRFKYIVSLTNCSIEYYLSLNWSICRELVTKTLSLTTTSLEYWRFYL